MMTNNLPVTYPRTVECICSIFDISTQAEWLPLNEGEMIVDTVQDGWRDEYMKRSEYHLVVTIDLISNVMADNSPLGTFADVFPVRA